MNLGDDPNIISFSEFLIERYAAEVEKVLLQPDEAKHYGITVK